MNHPAHAVVPNVDQTVELKEAKFRFKKDKLGNQRPTFELKNLPVPNANGIVEILTTGGKPLALLLEVVYDTVRAAAASIVADDEKISQESFPFDKVSWTAIANQERAERTKIEDSVWEAFAADYLAVMPAVTGKDAEQLGNAVSVYMKKFSIVKTNKPILAKLKEQLALYVEHSKQVDQFSDIIELLTNKLDTYLTSNDVELIINNL